MRIKKMEDIIPPFLLYLKIKKKRIYEKDSTLLYQ